MLLALLLAWGKGGSLSLPDHRWVTPGTGTLIERRSIVPFLWHLPAVFGCISYLFRALQGLTTGELFVVRNVANLCVNTDHSLLAALMYAVNVLEVRVYRLRYFIYVLGTESDAI